VAGDSSHANAKHHITHTYMCVLWRGCTYYTRTSTNRVLHALERIHHIKCNCSDVKLCSTGCFRRVLFPQHYSSCAGAHQVTRFCCADGLCALA